MPDIVKELSLNKHPKNCKDYSLVNARNIQVSNDFTCLQNEYSITRHSKLSVYLEQGAVTKVVVGHIPCNTEVILFVCYSTDLENIDSNGIDCTILRYNEIENDYIECITNFKYYGGKINGTFTYNVSNNLIIAVAEYGSIYNKDIPLRTLNLGKFDDETKYTDRDLDSGLHAASPELIVPKLSDFNYIPGNIYKGWYYLFFRYKINANDYTHWFPFGHPIFVCDIEKQSIFKYGFKANGGDVYNIAGALDYFSSRDKIANETIELSITNLDNKYKIYQIGFICVTKDSSKAFRTNDININNNINTHILSISDSISYSVENLILDNYNYYNVRSVINYQNKLYIGNFKDYSKPDIELQRLENIKIGYKRETISVDDYAYQVISNSNDRVISKETKSIDSPTSTYDIVEKEPVYNGSIFNGRIKKATFYISRNTQIPYTESGTIHTKNNQSIIATLEIKSNGINGTGTIEISSLINGKIYTAKGTVYAQPYDLSIYGVSITSNDFDKEIIVTGENTIDNSQPYFINTNNSFDKRKKESTLIPGEVYAFYIHFVNKYGEATDGYLIPNKFGADSLRTIIYDVVDEQNDTTYHIEAPYNDEIFNLDGTIKTDNISIHGYGDLNTVLPLLENSLSSVKSIANIKWYQLPNIDYPPIGQQKPFPFIPFINDNGDILYKVPFSDFIINGATIEYNLYKFAFDVSDFNLPTGYIGYYFSYEKFEPITKFRGILTKKDVSTQTEISENGNEVAYVNHNLTPITDLNSVQFYSSNLDINDNLNLELNAIHVIKKLSLFDSQASYYNNPKIDFANAEFPSNLNKPEISASNEIINGLYSIDKFSLSLANDVFKDKLDAGTSLDIELTDELKSLFVNENYYKVSLLNITTNLYTNKEKILIKFTDIYYNEVSDIVNKGLNGHFTYNNTIIYDFNKFIVDATNNIVSDKYGMYYHTDVFDENGYTAKYMNQNRAPLYYVQLYTYDERFNEAKSFKNVPQVYSLKLKKPDANSTSEVLPFAHNLIVLPINSIDLFENRYPNQDSLNPKTFVNYDENNQYVEEFEKRVRRSNVISSESNENSWRIFGVEDYKDITENKGVITNLVGVGTTLLVHTEHSLFMFDGDNVLQTNDRNVQLSVQDIFDMKYKEVFTSDLGMCGLQDDRAWIVDQFGYIFYDNDAHRIYKFGQGKIDIIDFDIVQFLNKFKPFQIRFANDKESNRLLIDLQIETYGIEPNNSIYKRVTLSYNYALGKWISFHDYYFDEAFNTKNILYFQLTHNTSEGKQSSLYIINNVVTAGMNDNSIENKTYNNFENTLEDKTINPDSQIDIICNTNYEEMKYLEFIVYKLYKINWDDDNYIPNPVEELWQPYSGETLRVFNHDVDTDILNILVDDYTNETKKNKYATPDKPWWELGNWNFNYLRDKSNLDNENMRYPSRLYGNYFVLSFTMKDSFRRIEFETLGVALTKDKQ